MGVPSDLRALAASGLLTGRELARVPVDSWLPRTAYGDDVSVGRLRRPRGSGRAVVDRLVEPLLGGVYAGRADELSLEATVPQLAAHARRERSLLAAARASRSGRPAAAGAGRRGVRRAPRRRRAGCPTRWPRLSGADVPHRRDGPRAAPDPDRLAARGRPDARRRRWSTPTRSCSPCRPRPRRGCCARTPRRPRPTWPQIRYASMAVVTLAFPATAFPGLPTGSGFLVPPVDGPVGEGGRRSPRRSGAGTPTQAPGLVVVRASVGRLGEEAVLQRDDAELVDLVARPTSPTLLGVTDPPVDARVTRWGGGLPQYAVGHRARVARVRAAVAALPGLAVCGAAYDGVGIPACVASGEQAAVGTVLRQCGATADAHRHAAGDPSTRPKARDLNQVIRYTMWSVFRLARPRCPTTGPRWPPRSTSCSSSWRRRTSSPAARYDVSGLRADADLMVWWHAAEPRRPAGGLRPVPPHRARRAPASRSGR